MKTKLQTLFPKNIDIAASLVVFIVAIPLTLGISLASGVSIEAGIISAIIGGIVVGTIAGAPLMVSGPAAGLSAIVFQLVQDYGFQGLMFITMCCGLFQILFAALKSGPVFKLVPHSILSGMLAAIGIIIMMGQVHVLFGQGVPSNFTAGILSLPDSALKMFDGANIVFIFLLGLLGIITQVYWPKIAKNQIAKKVPGALVAVALVTLFSLSLEMPRVSLAATSLFSENFLGNSLSYFKSDVVQLMGMIFMGFMVCLIASSESLLTARALGDLSEKKEEISDKNLNKELCAQGVGNTLCSILGGIPITGVIVRSAANINAGAQTRWSTILHGIWILVFVTFFAFIINSIPLTALAAVLVFTGWKLLGLDKMIEAYKKSKEDFVFLVGTILTILVTNLMIGMVVALVSYALWVAIKKRKIQKLSQING
jgi:MFS superfamily sulfate permease-like transporter